MLVNCLLDAIVISLGESYVVECNGVVLCLFSPFVGLHGTYVFCLLLL